MAQKNNLLIYKKINIGKKFYQCLMFIHQKLQFQAIS